MAQPRQEVNKNHSANVSMFYAVQEMRLDDGIWDQLNAGGPLDATTMIPAGGMTSYRQFPEQLCEMR